MKKKRDACSGKLPGLQKMMFVMRLCIFILLISFVSVSAKTLAQNERLSLDKHNASVVEVLNEISQKTSMQLLYNDNELKGLQVSVSLQNATLQETLDKVFSGLPLSYSIMDNVIVVSPKTRVATQTVETKVVTGVVKDKNGNVLPGATIQIKGTTVGVISDNEGKFKLEVAQMENMVLLVSFIGYKPATVTPEDDKPLVVVLEEEVQSMDEVVVVGYGTVKKKDLTGAISRVDEKILEESPATQIGHMLQGQVSGLQILNGSGAPGEPVQLQLRGVSSISGSISPLIVVDEIPMPSDYNLTDLNPSDIKSIDVLKGASSSAIYGSRAASGVIIITTKRGEMNTKPVINYKYSYGTQQLATDVNTLSAAEFKLLLVEAARNTAWEKGYNDIRDYEFYQTITKPDYFGKADTRWMNLLMNSASTQNHEVSMRGGAQSIQYYASLGYTDEEGLLKNSGYERYNVSLNLDSDINQYIKTGLSIRANISERQQSPITLADAVTSRSDLPAYNEDGSLYLHSYQYYGYTYYVKNPLLELTESSNKTKAWGLQIVGNLEVRILPELRLKAIYSWHRNNSEQDVYASSRTQQGSGYWSGQKGFGTNTVNNSWHKEFEGRLSYSKVFGDHVVDAVISGSIVRNKMHYRTWGMKDFSDDYVQNGIWQGVNYNKNYSGGDEKGAVLVSWIGRVNYKFMNRYLLTASIRRDGSSRFSPNYRYGNFPSVAIGWILSEENFFSNVSWLPFLKLRASFGKTGNDSVGEYGWRTLYTTTSYQDKPGLVPAQIGNDRLKWESTEQYDVGLDFAFIENQRITGTLGFYKKNTSGVLYPLKLTLGSGLTSTTVNLADMENKGIEFDIKAKIIDTKYFSWDFGFNIAKNVNKVTGLDREFVSNLGNNFLGNTVLQEGKTMGLFYGYKTDGIFQTWEEVNYYESLNEEHPYQTSQSFYKTSPGDIKTLDLNGDGYVHRVVNSEDQTILGSSIPDFTGGFNTRFSYRGLTLSIHGTFSYGNLKSWDAESHQFEFSSSMPSNLLDIALKRWTPENPTNKYPKIKVDPEAPYFSDFYLHDASFLKIQNIALNYKLPKHLIEKTKILENAEVFAAINNVYTFTKYPGPNPESFNSTDRIAGAAVDYSAYPGVRTYNFGVRIQLK
ncbi:MAG: TonB-dependent receptor [Odoribacter splanchnicus]